jgi:hypothetical protein
MHTRIYIEPEQKRQLAERARLHGNTFSEEVSCALDFYLALGVCAEDELNEIAREANLSAERIIRKLDDTTAYVRRTLAKANRPTRAVRSFPRN